MGDLLDFSLDTGNSGSPQDTELKQLADRDEHADGLSWNIPKLPHNKDFHLFISYAHDNSPEVRQIVEDLERKGLTCCYHERDFIPGQTVLGNMDDAISRSMSILFVLSEAFVQSRFCMYEIERALHARISENYTIIPIKIALCDIPEPLKTFTFIDAEMTQTSEMHVKILDAFVWNAVSTEESDDLAKVKVKILIPGLTVDKKIFGPAKPRNGDVDVTFQDSGFKVTALIKDEAGKAVRYEYKVKKLPGMIDVSKCFVQYKKVMIIISLAKKESQPWLPTLAAFGLDTADEEEPQEYFANEPLRPFTDSGIFADPYTLKEYEKAIIEGQERDRTIRLMIIGCYDQGKTTLARRLLYQPLEGTESTNGIDIHRVACKQDGKVWDRIEHEDINHEKIERLAVLPDIHHVVSNTDQEQSQIIYSRIPVADETEIIKSENVEETDNKNRPTLSHTVSPRKHSDLMLYKKIREELQTTEQDNKLALQLWDFGGQFVFYSTHQLFHARNAIYLLVFNLKRELDSPVIDKDYPGGARPFVKSMRDYITFWITSVHSFVGSRDGRQPKIVLVGTHKDELNNENEAVEYFQEVKKMFAKSKLRYHIYPKCFAISGKDLGDDTVTSIRETVMEIGKLNRQIIPARWLPLEMELRTKEKENILTYEKVNEINHSLEYSRLSEAQMKAFLKFHHFRGTFIYFDEGEMAKHVVVNPPFIVDAFRGIITSGEFCNSNETLELLWQKLTESAILEPELIQAVWALCPDRQFIKFKDVLVSLLKRHRIIAEAQKFNEESEELESLNFYLVPSFLRKPRSNEIQEFMKGRTCTKVSIVYVFDNEAIVQTIFQRVTCAAIGSWPVIDFRESQLLFENAGVYELNNINYAGIILHTGNKIEITVVHMCTGNAISAKFPDYLRRLVEYVMKKEFRKLLVDDRYLIDDTPYSTSLRCMDEYHCCKGSKKIYDLEMLKAQKERDVCCPDKEAHACINVEDALQEWFDYKVCYKDVPQRRLDEKIDATQFTELSFAFGDEWELLGRLLGLSKVMIQHVKMDNQNTAMRIYDMLMKWENDIQEEATIGKLLTAIEKLPKQSVDWDIVKNLIDKID